MSANIFTLGQEVIKYKTVGLYVAMVGMIIFGGIILFAKTDKIKYSKANHHRRRKTSPYLDRKKTNHFALRASSVDTKAMLNNRVSGNTGLIV